MRAARILLAGLLGFLLLEALIFRTKFYASIISPDSSTGVLELRLQNEIRREVKDRNQVLAVGDSRMGFFPRYANELKLGYTFASISTAGTTPRSWYYMLRATDPAARRYAAIIIPMEDYDDSETWDDHANYVTDLHYLIARLGFRDLVEFSGSFHKPDLKWQAARGILLKGLIYKRDFQDFLLHPVARMQYVSLARNGSANWYYDFKGSSQDMTGVIIDWEKRELSAPSSVSPAKKQTYADRFLFPRPPDHERQSAFLKYWFNKIYQRYRGSGTRIIFIRLPRGPFIRPDQPPWNPHSSVRDLAAHPDVILTPEHLFDSLEASRWFMDEIHLNGPGSAEFSRMLAWHAREQLGEPRAF